MMAVTWISDIKGANPGVECCFDLVGIAVTEFAPSPVTITILRQLEIIKKLGNSGVGDLWRFNWCAVLRRNPPDPSRIAITAGIAHRVLIVALDRIIPIANVERPARAEAQIDRNETEVGGKQNVVHILFLIAELAFDPLVKLDSVGGFIARFDETALHLFGKGWEIDKVVAAGAGIRGKANRLGMLLGVGRIEGVKGRCENRMTGDVLSPLVESDAPGIGA